MAVTTAAQFREFFPESAYPEFTRARETDATIERRLKTAAAYCARLSPPIASQEILDEAVATLAAHLLKRNPNSAAARETQDALTASESSSSVSASRSRGLNFESTIEGANFLGLIEGSTYKAGDPTPGTLVGIVA